jgi:hypothetical protein
VELWAELIIQKVNSIDTKSYLVSKKSTLKKGVSTLNVYGDNKILAADLEVHSKT